MNITNPLVSIITVCFNSKTTIEKTISSVLNQTYKNIEYIIVDGLSTDGTIEVINRFVDLFKKNNISFKVVSEKDNGIYDAMNKGISMSRGEIIGIINSDDWYEPIAVETAVNMYQETKYDLFYADIRIIKQNGKSFIKKAKKRKLASSRYWNHPTTFITAKTYDDLGKYKCHCIYDDFDMYLRVRKAKKNIRIKNMVLANFTMGGVSNKKSIKNAIKRYKFRYWCYRNNVYSIFYFFECFLMEIVKFILS